MTDILESPVTSALDDDSPLARLFAMVDDEYTEDEQRDDAQIAAAHHAYTVYGATIGQVLEDMDWAGQIAVKDNRLEASAVAWLEGGLWLHHTRNISEADGARDVLMLIVPCACGRGYVDFQLEGEEDLLQILTDLRRTGGRAAHQHDEDCASVPDPHAPTTK
ncbi:hypothetical protein StrepF001_45110 [Streptomyces sp. F001]|uniref:hypothetical protein n=1 Tax=Streptomyces sp. F001 TaxID=1510026 RepID=UPI00101E2B11|nr:hypothetical protein [Streptomyces sp. F001]RZB13267.1 hypothetical protein StrepF001_45110 [Streptomyces sp. F001]